MARFVLINALGGRRAGEVLDDQQGDASAIAGLTALGGHLVLLPNSVVEQAAEKATAAYARGAGDEMATGIMLAVTGGGSTCAPLTIIVYVDNGTTTALADQNGSICTPYSTIQGAIDAHAADGVLRVTLTNGTYPENVVVPASMSLALSCDWGAEGAGIAVVDSITADNTLLLQGVYAGSLTISSADTHGSGPVFGAEQIVFAALTGAVSVVADVVEAGDVSGEGFKLALHAHDFPAGGSSVQEINSPGLLVSLRGMRIDANIATDGSVVHPNNTLEAQDCEIWREDGTSVVTGGSQTYTRCRFQFAGSLTTVFAPTTVVLVDCEFAAAVVITCSDVQFDLYSWQRFVAAGGTVIGTVTIVGSLYQPAVPANWVGSPPTTIYEALDRIAAALGPIA